MTTWSDTDHAVCENKEIYERLSSHWGSSAEAEFYGLVSAASSALGEQSMLKAWGISCPISILMDASNGIAIGSRRGLGKVRHIDAFVWVQDLVQDETLKMVDTL